MNPTSTNDRTKRLFLEARELPEPEQERFVRRAADEDNQLADRVLRLLKAARSAAAEAIDIPAIDLTELRRAARPSPGELPPLGEKYRAIRVIGFGGAGDVYLCEQLRPVRREVAIKLLRPTVVSESGVRRIEREARLLAGLDHPGIARLLDVGEASDGRPFIVMEFVDGLPIDLDCQEHRAPTRERLDLFRELCDAVHHAHQRGVIHRDIKPANVLVERSGDRPRVRLVDLGVAKLIDDGRSLGPSLTVTGAVVGSLGFMSPEQRSGGRASTLCDVYALGVLLYCLLTDAPPPKLLCTNQRAVIRASPKTKALRGDLGTVVARAISPEPADRYETVRELDEDIARYLNHEPIRARGPNALYTAGKFVRRHWAASVATALVLATALASFMLVNASRIEAIHAHAETQYTEARRISNYFLRDVVTRLYRIPGSQEIQFDLLNELLRQTEDFLQSRPDDPSLLDDYADTLYALCDVHSITPGARDAAIDYIQRALDVRLRLVEAAPDNTDFLMKLGVAYARRGDFEMRSGGPDGAVTSESADRTLGYYTKALKIDRRLVEIDPDSRRYRDNLYWSHDRIASVLHRSGRPGALRWARDALEVAEELASRHPDHYLTAFALSQAHMKLGRVLHDNGMHEHAAPYLLIAAEHAERLNEIYPNAWHFMRYLNYAYAEIAKNAKELGEFQIAQDALAKRIEIAESLNSAEPGGRWRALVSDAQHRLTRFREDFEAADRADGIAPEHTGPAPD